MQTICAKKAMNADGRVLLRNTCRGCRAAGGKEGKAAAEMRNARQQRKAQRQPLSKGGHLVGQQRADVVVVAGANVVNAGEFGPDAEHFLVGGEGHLQERGFERWKTISVRNQELKGFESADVGWGRAECRNTPWLQRFGAKVCHRRLQ
jgi:hypothetical protein